MKHNPSGNTKDCIRYRYPGLSPFNDNDRDRRLFFGRARDQKLLLNKILAERLVVLYAKSGMGKTSLLNAGVFESLRENEYLPLTIRVRDISNDFMTVFYSRIEDELNKCKDKGFISESSAGEKNTLWEYFKTVEFWSPDDRLLTPVLILDQFEELFTLSRNTYEQNNFIKQLSDLIRGRVPLQLIEKYSGKNGDKQGRMPFTETPPGIKIVIAIRENYYGRLQDLSKKIPGIFENRFLLDPLSEKNAKEAIVGPTGISFDDTEEDIPSITYTPEAVNKILNFLSPKKTDSTIDEVDIEPFQLQLLCSRIEKETLAGKSDQKEIQADKLTPEWMNYILEEFYDEEINDLPQENREKVRNLIENQMINKSGNRITYDGDTIINEFDISEEILNYLADRRLLTKEPRRKGFLYELSHDTMVKPIRESQKKREKIKLREEQLEKERLEKERLEKERIEYERREKERIEKEKHKLQIQYGIGAAIIAILLIFSIIIFKINTPGYQYNEAISFLKKNKYEEARIKLESVVEKSPDHSDALEKLGNEYNRTGKVDHAIDHWKRAAEIEKENHEICSKIGREYIKKGEIKKGIAFLITAINRYPKNIDYYLELADIFEKFKPNMKIDGKDGIDALYKKGKKANPDNWDFYYALANIYYLLANRYYAPANRGLQIDLYSKAAGNFQLAIEKNEEELLEKYPKLYKNMGDTYFRLEKFPDSIIAYNKFLNIITKEKHDQKISLNYQQLFLNLGFAHFSIGNPEEAKNNFSEAKKYIAPGTLDIFINLGKVYREQKRFDNAIMSYETAKEISPGSFQVFMELGDLYSEKKEFGNAIGLYTQAISLIDSNMIITDNQRNETLKQLYFSLGNACSCGHRFQKAVEYYKKVIDKDPNYPPPHMRPTSTGNIEFQDVEKRKELAEDNKRHAGCK